MAKSTKTVNRTVDLVALMTPARRMTGADFREWAKERDLSQAKLMAIFDYSERAIRSLMSASNAEQPLPMLVQHTLALASERYVEAERAYAEVVRGQAAAVEAARSASPAAEGQEPEETIEELLHIAGYHVISEGEGKAAKSKLLHTKSEVNDMMHAVAMAMTGVSTIKVDVQYEGGRSSVIYSWERGIDEGMPNFG